ncbi:MAG: Bug family tripartite tricarboxylate transporter substrate binding protein [Burkholderiaceae bacterium]
MNIFAAADSTPASDLDRPNARRHALRWLACGVAGAAVLAAGALPSAAQAQAWPSKPIRIVVPYGPGSSPDVIARIVAERLSPRLGQPVVIETRAGAGGNTGTGQVAKAAGDGYTYVISTNGPLVYNTVLYRQLSYDPFNELRPVILAGGQANVCAVRSDSGITSLKGLVDAMKANPGKFNFSSTGVGSLSQLGVELLKVKTGTFAVHIPYASSPLAIQAILQGDVQFACVPAVAVMPQVRAGKMRALAVSTGKRSELTPEIPTMKEAGLPEIENLAWMAIMAPASTPTPIVQRLNQEINAVLAMPEVKQRLHSQFMEPIGGSPDDLAKFMQTELREMKPVIERTGIKVD